MSAIDNARALSRASRADFDLHAIGRELSAAGAQPSCRTVLRASYRGAPDASAAPEIKAPAASTAAPRTRVRTGARFIAVSPMFGKFSDSPDRRHLHPVRFPLL